MFQLIIAAFTMGLIGSFHCVGMCGPLALSLPLNNDSFLSKFSGALLYNAGRIVTYAVFGFVFGVIGKSFALFGYQQWLSVILGVVIIFFISVALLANANATFHSARFRIVTRFEIVLICKKGVWVIKPT